MNSAKILEESYTIEDIYNLQQGERAELQQFTNIRCELQQLMHTKC